MSPVQEKDLTSRLIKPTVSS